MGFGISRVRLGYTLSKYLRKVNFAPVTTTLRGKSTGALLDPSGGPSAPGRRFYGERGAPLRYAPTPHSPQGDCTGLLRKRGLDANHDYVIEIKGKI